MSSIPRHGLIFVPSQSLASDDVGCLSGCSSAAFLNTRVFKRPNQLGSVQTPKQRILHLVVSLVSKCSNWGCETWRMETPLLHTLHLLNEMIWIIQVLFGGVSGIVWHSKWVATKLMSMVTLGSGWTRLNPLTYHEPSSSSFKRDRGAAKLGASYRSLGESLQDGVRHVYVA